MKKKIVAVVLAMVMILVALTGCVTYTNDCPEQDHSGINRIYDVNRDGKIDNQDIKLAWHYMCGGRFPWLQLNNITDSAIWSIFGSYKVYNKYAELLYDVNCDGDVNWDDIVDIWEHRD